MSKLALLGSRAGEDYGSDIDILLEIEPDTAFSLLKLIDVETIIEDATGLQAQATVRRSTSSRFASHSADDIVEIF